MPTDTIIHRLFENARARGEQPAYHRKVSGQWQATNYRDYAEEVRQAAKALLALGIDGGAVCILGFNRPEWVIADLAIMAVGGAAAGIYTTCSAPEVRYIINHAEAKLCVVENLEQWQKIQAEKAELPGLEYVVTMRGAPAIDDPLVLSWDEFMSKGDASDDAQLEAAVEALKPDQLATLIYTSGTTGPPKGVMLSHENLAWTAGMLRDVIGGRASDRSLSYLPLSHIAEQTATILGPITMGASVYFAESLEKVPDNLKEVRPTIVFGVPRIWEKFHAGIDGKLKLASGLKAALVKWARGVGSRVSELRCQGQEPRGALGLSYRLADRLVFAKLKQAVGLDQARILVSGAAPISKEVVEFFASLDLLIQEIYGQSEDTGPTSFNLQGKTRFGSVGVALPGVEVKLAKPESDAMSGEGGEILVRGKNVFMGYYKDPVATDETLIKGWLYSGDLGRFDDDGFLYITGRKKEIIITAGGKNITPKNIEAGIKNHWLVSEAVIIGDKRKFLSALVTLEEDAKKRFAEQHALSLDSVHESKELRAEIQSAIDAVNREFAKVEQVKKFAILPRSLSVEEGELTPTLKVKRRVVNQNWSKEIEAMYDQ